MTNSVNKLVVCYVPGLDTRRISHETTPAISDLFEQYRHVEIRTIPDTELVPTLLSGVYPHQNGLWQVSVDDPSAPTNPRWIVDALPDLITTSAQCVRQRFNSDFDLAAIPPRRRQRFTQHRMKYTRRAEAPELITEFNGYQTVFGVLGQHARYRFADRFDQLSAILNDLPTSTLRLEFLEMYALDLYQHWHLDDEARMRDVMRKTDSFVATLNKRCAQTGRTMMLLSDHGQELVGGTVPFVQALQNCGVPEREYSYFCTLACARIWFHTDRSRADILEQLRELPNCSLHHFSEMHQYDVRFDDARYGEYYLMAEAGYIFFPHDFYQPFANLYLGLFGESQRTRIFRPIHRGNHGYLPSNPSEKGFLLLADEAFEPQRKTMSLIDLAPTVLNCLDAETPPHMEGHSVF